MHTAQRHRTPAAQLAFQLIVVAKSMGSQQETVAAHASMPKAIKHTAVPPEAGTWLRWHPGNAKHRDMHVEAVAGTYQEADAAHELQGGPPPDPGVVQH